MSEPPSAPTLRERLAVSLRVPHRGRQIGRFLSRHAWLLRDALGGRRHQLASLLVISALAAATQGASVGILGFFIHRVSSSGELELGLSHIGLGQSATTLALLAGSLFAALLAHAWFTYSAAKVARSISRDYQRTVIRRVLHSLAALADGSRQPLAREDVEMLGITGARLIGRALDLILRSLPALPQLAVAATIALGLQPRFTLALLPLFLLLGPFLYRLGGDVQRGAREFYDSALGAAAMRIRELAGILDSSRIPCRAPLQRLSLSFDGDAVLDRYFELDSNLLIASDRAIFVTACFRSFLILAVTAIAGYASLQGAMSWGALAAYLGSLGVLMNNVQKLASLGARLNRMYLSLDRYVSFVAELPQVAAPPPVREAPEQIALRIKPQSGEAPFDFQLRRGAPVYLGVAREIGRLGAASVLQPLLDASPAQERGAWTSAAFVTRTAILSGQSLAELIASPSDHPAAALQAAARDLQRLGVWDEVAALPQGLETPLDTHRWWALSPALRVGAFVLALRESTAPVVLLSDALFAGTKAEFQRDALALLADRIVVLLAAGPLVSELELPVLVPAARSLHAVWERDRYTADAQERCSSGILAHAMDPGADDDDGDGSDG